MKPQSVLERIGEEGMFPKGITIHNTGNDLSAQEVYDLILKSPSDRGCHYLVDENEVIEVLPHSWKAWHTGKGYDLGNTATISIEICRSRSKSEVYNKAEARAIQLIKDLMKMYGFEKEDLYFHNDWNPKTYCPHRILQKYKSKQNWIKEVFG